MKLIPFRKPAPEPEPEKRNYTDVVTNALVEAAADSQIDAYVSALETAAGHLSRAFAAATITGTGASVFTPWVMTQIGRSLIEEGEAVWFRRGRELVRAQQYTFTPPGRYQISNPDGLRTLGDDRVLHVRWNLQVASGRGLSPLGTARTLRTLMYRLENSLANEANAPVGYLLPLPTDGHSTTVEKLRDDIAALKGRIAVIETTATGWGEGPRGGGNNLGLERLGPSYPQDNVAMFKAARQAVLVACGMPAGLAEGGGQDGGAQRESWRRYLHGTVAPLGRLVALEAERIGLPITIDWDQLFASDIAGRARAFQSLVGGGMDITQAAAASGLLSQED